MSDCSGGRIWKKDGRMVEGFIAPDTGGEYVHMYVVEDGKKYLHPIRKDEIERKAGGPCACEEE